jgi:diguanylate cyclase (GGDEF)-like protein
MELAAALSRCLRHDVAGKDDAPLSRDLAWLSERLTREHGCDADELGKLLQEVRSGLRQAATVFDVQLGDPRAIEELQVRTGQLLVQLSLGLAREADTLEASRRELADLAALDGLTGLPNRRTLEARYGELFDAARAAGRPLGVVMIDLDLFKQVNDRHGHQAGDELLQAMGRALQASRRDGELFARYGGEEFCAVVPATSSLALEARAEGLRAAIATLHVARPAGGEVRATASIGAAFAPTAAAAATKEALRDAADRALYAAKERGRDRVVVTVLGSETVVEPSRAPAAEPKDTPTTESTISTR